MDRDQALRDVHTALGHKQLSRGWAKAEIVLGLAAAGVGNLLGSYAVVATGGVDWGSAGASVALFVLGGYLALAGHRSHLYQSNNELTAYLAEAVRSPRGPAT